MSSPTTEAPNEVLDATDPGDDTQRRFRYQHAYGVILLVAGLTSKKPWVALWCEHHEDFLAERGDGRFEGFQVKTRLPEHGAWKITDSALVKSIGRFVSQNTKFPEKFESFHFVTNSAIEKGKAEGNDPESPQQLIKKIGKCSALADVDAVFRKVIKVLGGTLKAPEDEVFQVLRKLRFSLGPSLDNYEASVAHELISTVPGFESLPAKGLDAARDELIGLIFRSSSLAVADPERFWEDICGMDSTQTKLNNKRIRLSEALDCLKRWRRPTFRFAPPEKPVELNGKERSLDVLTEKMEKGGLGSYVGPMKRRALSAEQFLLELSYKDPEEINNILNQLDGVVTAECSDAQLEASEHGEPYGEKMMRLIMSRIRSRLKSDPTSVHDFDYDCLIGVVGMLTDDCKVWWSEKFKLEHTK